MLSFIAVPVYAKRFDYMAYGKLVDYGVESDAHEVINGHWYIRVNGDNVRFRAYYRERNLDATVENSPVGSIDHFWISLVELDNIDIDYDTGECTLSGIFKSRKLWAILPSHEAWPRRYVFLNPQWEGYGTVTIDENGIVIWFWGELLGPITNIQH